MNWFYFSRKSAGGLITVRNFFKRRPFSNILCCWK